MSNNLSLSKIREYLTDVDGILITSLPNIYYISGFSGSTANLLITKDTAYILTDFRYTIQAKNECVGFEVVDSACGPAGLYQKHNIKNLAYEDESMSVSAYNKMEEEIKNVEFVPYSKKIISLRSVKTQEEIDAVSTAASIADAAFSHILSFIKPGVTEAEIALELEFFMRKNGASHLSFDTIVAAGKRGAMCHAQPTDKEIEKGDFVTMDFGCVYNHYCSDMTRTIAVGTCSPTQRKIYDIVYDAQIKGLEAAKAGVICSDIDAVSRNVIKDAGYGDNFGHGLGHSLGLLIHENPRFSTLCHDIVEKNMIMSIEPGIYIEDFGGVRIEDIVVITENMPILLCKSSKELIIV